MSEWVPPSTRRRGTVPPGDMRVSDAERRETADLLSEHHAEGRLDAEEFNERVEKAMAAKVRSDLDALLVDLPPLDGSPPQLAAPPHRHVGVLRSAVFVVFALISLSFVQGAMHLHFLVVALVVAAVLLLARHDHDRHAGAGRAA